MQTAASTYLSEAIAIWLRDLRGEFRTRFALNAIFMFAITTLITVSFAIGAYSIAEAERSFLYSVLLWIILLFSALSGIAHSFVKEAEAGTIDTLKLSARPNAIFLGKLFFNLTLLIFIELLIVPLFIILMKFPIQCPGYFSLMMLTGGLSLGSGTTLVAAMITRASVKGALFSVLSFPLLLPLVIISIKGCERASQGVDLAGWSEVKIALAYLILMTVASFFLFPIIWEE
ncbi:heme exporter protein CcmB [candidate division KSB1 bacterium]|nr:heme exporter protein CcmB [candidate division KSB1 bacterium]